MGKPRPPKQPPPPPKGSYCEACEKTHTGACDPKDLPTGGHVSW